MSLFIPKLVFLCHQFRELLKKSNKFIWTPEQDIHFEKIKQTTKSKIKVKKRLL